MLSPGLGWFPLPKVWLKCLFLPPLPRGGFPALLVGQVVFSQPIVPAQGNVLPGGDEHLGGDPFEERICDGIVRLC